MFSGKSGLQSPNNQSKSFRDVLAVGDIELNSNYYDCALEVL
jgi:hypothetical protein